MCWTHSEMMRSVTLWFVVAVVITSCGLFPHPGVSAAPSCPGECACPPLSQNVYCSRKKLPFIPSGIPVNTLQLNLNDNNFQNPIVSRSNFSKYPVLEHLYLSGCGIEFISVDTFTDLVKLKWLDLSKNRLKVIADYTFRGLRVANLFLNDNPGVQISTGAFQGLRTKGLYIHNCAIANISLKFLSPLNGTLKMLWMDGNKFDRFGKECPWSRGVLTHWR
jgi:hypothetical protein